MSRSVRCLAACLLLLPAAVFAETAHAAEPAAHAPPPAGAHAGAHAAKAEAPPPVAHASEGAATTEAKPAAEARPAAGAKPAAKPAEHAVQVLEPSIRPLAPATEVKHALKPVAPVASLYARPAVKKVRAKPHAVKKPAAEVAVPTSLDRALAAVSTLTARFHHAEAHELPRAVVLACADEAPRNRVLGKGSAAIYVAQNRGNQLMLGDAAVSYAVRQLHAPLLVVLARSDCKAVDLARKDFSHLSRPEQQELLGINVDKGSALMDAQMDNLDNQVDAAVLKFGGEVEAGELSVIGAYFDSARGGRLVVTNINGEQDKRKIAAMLRRGDVSSAMPGMAEEAPSQHKPAQHGADKADAADEEKPAAH